MNIWFTSDLHWFHRNIVTFTNRHLFTDADNHTEWLIEIWNKQVKKGDTVYHLGDFSFAKDTKKTLAVIERLNGTIHMIKGNHDYSDNFKQYSRGVNGVYTHDYLEKQFDGQKVVMFHFPIASWHQQHRGSWHLHGHSHGMYTEGKGKILDVGIDNVYNLFGEHRLLNFDEIKQYMDKREVYIADTHRENRVGDL
jgi:calcineurin-like phosphoesterase family protein